MRARVGVRHVAHARLGAVLGAKGEHLVDGALGVGDEPALHLVEHRHALAVGVEGLLEGARVGVFKRLRLDAELLGKEHERALRRVAQHVAGVVGVHFGVDAQRAPLEKIAVDGGVVFFGELADGRGGAIDEVVADGDARHRHFIEGEGARLIAADDGRAAQRFDGGQAFDEGVLLRHALHAQRHDDGAGGGQALGDDGDGEGDGDEDVVDPRLPAVADEADGEDEHADDEADEAERLAHGIELALHRGVRLVLLV